MIIAIIILIMVSLILGFIGSIVVTQSKLKKRIEYIEEVIECIVEIKDIFEGSIKEWNKAFRKQREQYRILSTQVDELEKAIVDIEKSIIALDTQIDQIEDANK